MKFWYKADFLAFAAIIILSIFALKSLLAPGFYTSHDGENHTTRIAQYFLAMHDGQFPPRFAGSFYNYLGSPIFIYIYPLPYILGTIVHTLGFSFANTFKLLMALGFIFSQVFTYLWLLALFKDKKSALIGALFYGWVPYRFLLIYVRGSLSEVVAYTFVPLVFYCVTMLSFKKTIKWMVLATFSISLLLLSQDLVAYITIPIFGTYTLFLAFREHSWNFLIKALAAAIWAFFISSFTYLPALFERNYIIFNSAFNGVYNGHFVCFWQLIHSAWGYGFDFPGCANDGLSLQIGLAQLMIFIIFVVIQIYYFFKKVISRKNLHLENENFLLILSIFFGIVFLISIFLMLDTNINKFVWDKTNVLHIIDIPWRLLGLTSISSAFIAAYLVKHIKSGLFLLLLIAALLIANRNHIRINKAIEYSDQQFLTYTGNATERSEFTPNYGVNKPPILKNRVDIISGESVINNLTYNSRLITFNINVLSQNSQIRINKYYFPGIKVIDNKKNINDKINLFADQRKYGKEIAEESKGLLNINLEKGFHNIRVEFLETKLRLFADYVSLLSVLFAIIIYIKYAKN